MDKMKDVKKQKEWYQWGKEGYKSGINMMRRNSHHPDYDTPEKVKAQLDNYRGWMCEPERLKTRFGYDDEDCVEAVRQYQAGFNASRKWNEKRDQKYIATMAKYQPIIDEANALAATVDVSDLKDGFPCGWAHLYLQRYPEAEDLYEALGNYVNSDSKGEDCWTRQLPIRYKKPGQYIGYDEKILKVVQDFLRTKGIFTSMKSVID